MQESFSKRVAELRKQKGLSMRALGRACGVVHNVISAHECGVLPRLDTAINLSSALGVSMDYLFGRRQDHGAPCNGSPEMFSEMLRALRGKQGLSQVVLSELCGFESARVYQWEHCGVLPGIEAVAQLADFFNVSMDYLCGHSEDQQGPC